MWSQAAHAVKRRKKVPDRRFPISGTSVPPMVGRQAIMGRMVRALTKPTPDNLQIVGARYAGKTVILHELARHLREAGTPYTAVVLCDLNRQTPETDELFMQRLARELSAELRMNHAEYAAHIQNPQGNRTTPQLPVALGIRGCTGILVLFPS